MPDVIDKSLTIEVFPHQDAILRRSGMYTIAMAYCGTGSNAAIRRLLHVAVSDVNDDVRRAAVMALGFILFKTPEQCPSLVSLLSESYNPHVRFVIRVGDCSYCIERECPACPKACLTRQMSADLFS